MFRASRVTGAGTFPPMEGSRWRDETWRPGRGLAVTWVDDRAVNGHVPGDDKQTDTRLRMFLDGHP